MFLPVRRSFPALMLGCALLAAAPISRVTSLHAQAVGATLSGLITDSSGAVIPNAVVVITNPATGSNRQLKTDGKGFYSANNLQPGNYQLRASAAGFNSAVQKDIVLNVGGTQELDLSLRTGDDSQTVTVTTGAPMVEVNSAQLGAIVDSRTVRELPINGRDWTSLAALEPGVASVATQATTGFSANKGNRGFGNQLTDAGHRPNENLYRVNGVVINDYSNAAPGGATGLNLGVDAIQEFSVITSGYTAEYGRTSGAIINGITRSGTNALHGSGFFFDRDKIFDASRAIDPPGVKLPFRRIQFGGAAGGPIWKDHTFIFGAYEGVRQSQSTAVQISVPDAASRATAVAAIVPYLALYPIAPAGSPDVNGINTFSLSSPNRASENYATGRLDHRIGEKDSLNASYFFDSGPQQQADPLNNAIHSVFSRRQTAGIEENHIFSSAIANTARFGYSRLIGLINNPVSGNAVATNSTLAVAPGAAAPPQLPVSGLTTAFGLGGLNRFNHEFNSYQAYDDLFITKGSHSLIVGAAFEHMAYNVLEILSPNGRFSTFAADKTAKESGLSRFLRNAPNTLNAVAPGQSHEVDLRENIIAGYIQDNWRATKRLTVTAGVRYEFATKPTDATTIPGYTVNGYTVAAGGFQQIQSLTNCTSSPTACGPVGTDSPFNTNPTTKNVEPRVGLAWDVFGDGKTAFHAAGGLFDVLPLPYEFGLNTAATAPFQIIGAAPGSTLGSGINNNINFNPQRVRNRYIQPDPKRALVVNYNASVEQQITSSISMRLGYVGSRSVHLSVAADDINLVQPVAVPGVGIVFPQGGTRVDPNWGGSAGIRPVIFNGASAYSGLQAQLRKQISHGLQGQLSYAWAKCNDLSSSPVTGDTFQNSIAVPILSQKAARLGACDFDLRHLLTGNVVYTLPTFKEINPVAGLFANGWEIGSILTRQSGSPFTATLGGGGDPLGTGFNGDYSMATASILAGCNPIHGGRAYLNRGCFTPPTVPATYAVASATNPLGCVPGYNGVNAAGQPYLTPPPGQQFCSNVLGNTRRNQFSGPGLVTMDVSLFKNTPIKRISENFVTQFRAEAFNVFNHPNYLTPGFLSAGGQNNSVYDASGADLKTNLNELSTSARQIQLGFKILF